MSCRFRHVHRRFNQVADALAAQRGELNQFYWSALRPILTKIGQCAARNDLEVKICSDASFSETSSTIGVWMLVADGSPNGDSEREDWESKLLEGSWASWVPNAMIARKVPAISVLASE